MMKIERCPSPDWLETNSQKWGEEYERTRSDNWKSYKVKPVNRHLLPLLREMTNNHCSFCDDYPLETSGETIEHFRPKSTFPLLAYQWSNLFYCCNSCQNKKGDRFREELLKPDEEAYAFETYFIYDSITGEIKPNPACSTQNKERAEITIALYGLNKFGRPRFRKKYQQQFRKTNDPDVQDFPYRFIY